MFALHKRDKNEKAIVAALTAAGGRVTKIQGCPGGDGDFGVPDLLVGYRGRTILFEVKEPDTNAHTARSAKGKRAKGNDGPPENAKGQLTPTQVKWWAGWIGGEAHVVETPAQAVALMKGEDLPGIRVAVDTDEQGAAVVLGLEAWEDADQAPPMLTPGEADALAGALHEQAGVARSLAAKPPTCNTMHASSTEPIWSCARERDHGGRCSPDKE